MSQDNLSDDERELLATGERTAAVELGEVFIDLDDFRKLFARLAALRVECAAREAAFARATERAEGYENEVKLYHRAMGCLRRMRLNHGKCLPRSHRACTACNAKEELDAIVDAYRGGIVSLAAPSPAPHAGDAKPQDVCENDTMAL